MRGTLSEASGLSRVTQGCSRDSRVVSGGQSMWSLAHPRRALPFARLEMGNQGKVLGRGTEVTCVPAGCWVEHRLKAARSRGPVTARIQVRKDSGSRTEGGTLTTDAIGCAAPPHLRLQNSSSPVPGTPDVPCGGCGMDTGLCGPRELCGPESRPPALGLAADERSMTGARGCQCGFS